MEAEGCCGCKNESNDLVDLLNQVRRDERQMCLVRMRDTLNEIFANDPEAITALVNHRVPCNKSTAEHPTVQVGRKRSGEYTLGLVGLLNGMIDPNLHVRLAAVIDRDLGGLVEFRIVDESLCFDAPEEE